MESTASAQGPLGDPDALVPGSQAGPWRIERELGRGGMGTVYAVTHAEIGKQAALKVVHRRVLSPGEDRMLLEAQVVNLVGHPNIVDIFETGHLEDQRPYLVMERLEGVSLAQRADEGKLFPDQVISILLQVCDALIAAHATGIIHRDLKLDNVFLIDNADDPKHPRVKLLDWGIAKVIVESGRKTLHHTVDGQLIGTPQYLAPEQARGGEVSPKTDVYSLGVMAYELFLEHLPFEAETAAEIMTMHLRATPPPASEAWPDIPPALEELLNEMLAKQPDHRPTMLDVARRLETIRDELDRRRLRVPTTETPVAQPVDVQAPVLVNDSSSSASWVPPTPRWQWVVGAAAICATICLFLVSQLVDTADAGATTLGDTPALLSPADLAGPLAKPPEAPASAAAPAAPVIASEPAPLAVAEEAPVTDKPTKPRIKQAPRAPSRTPAAPRRNARLDPDGTFDPYR
jgi:serine/threonine protein kinase